MTQHLKNRRLYRLNYIIYIKNSLPWIRSETTHEHLNAVYQLRGAGATGATQIMRGQHGLPFLQELYFTLKVLLTQF